MPEMTPAQRERLQTLCENYGVPFRASDYYTSFDLPTGYVCGWIGGNEHAGRTNSRGERMAGGTLFVGVDPDGRSSS